MGEMGLDLCQWMAGQGEARRATGEGRGGLGKQRREAVEKRRATTGGVGWTVGRRCEGGGGRRTEMVGAD
jgi:hypothetical protein